MGITKLPVEYLVAISNPATILTTNSSSKQLLQKVVHGYNLLDRIKEISEKYRTEIINAKIVRKISKQLLKQHTPAEIDILKKFPLTDKNVQSVREIWSGTYIC